jgi:hypothetical protein
MAKGYGTGHRLNKDEVVGATAHNDREDGEIADPDISDKC